MTAAHRAALPLLFAPILSACTTLERRFADEVRAAVAKHPPRPAGVVTEAELARLPDPVARHFRAAGFVGRPHAVNFRIVWKEMLLKTGRDRPWMKVSCDQFNAAPDPVRLALMRGRVALLPFEGRDKLQDGHGNMLVKLVKVITVGDSKGAEMDQSALVTFLAESLLAPSFALAPYVSWEPVDERTARAALVHGGQRVTGTFRFDGAGRPFRFETVDRWQDGKPPKKIPWSAQMSGYQVRDGVAIPTRLEATWHEEKGDFPYVTGTIDRIVFNVSG